MDGPIEIPEPYGFLREWIRSDNPVHRAHAEARIKLGFDRSIAEMEEKPTSERVSYTDPLSKQAGIDSPIATAPPQTIPLAGDLVEAAAHRIGADRLARWVAAKLGVDCGCAARHARLNDLDAKIRTYLARKDRE